MKKEEPFILRGYQNEAVDSIEAAIMFGSDNVTLRAVTSYGKSAVIAKTAEYFEDQGVMIIVNITELIDQIAKHLDHFNIDYSILKAGRDKDFDPSKKVQLVMAQTLYSRIETIQFDHKFNIFQQDEIHKEYGTKRTSDILECIKPGVRIGYSGTPWDASGFALHGTEIIETADDNYLTSQGFLSPIKYFIPRWSEKIDYSKVKMTAGEYNLSELDQIIGNESFLNNMVESMNARKIKSENKKFIVFTTTIEMCDRVTMVLKAARYNVEAYHSKVHKKTQKNIMDSFKYNKEYIGPHQEDTSLFDEETTYTPVRGLVSVAKLTTGFDVPDIDVGVLGRKFGPSSLFHQAVGRIKRTSEFKMFGEVLDLGANISFHGFPEDPYTPPERTGIKELDKQNIIEAKKHLSMDHMSAIIQDDIPEEITRERYEFVLDEIKKNKIRLTEMSTRQLSDKLEISNDPVEIIAITAVLFDKIHCEDMVDNYGRASRGYISNKDKEVIGFINPKSIGWIAELWVEKLEEEKEYYRNKYIKALRTRAKNMLIQKNSIFGLRFFIEYLQEQDALNKEIAEQAQKETEVVYEGFDNEGDDVPW